MVTWLYMYISNQGKGFPSLMAVATILVFGLLNAYLYYPKSTCGVMLNGLGRSLTSHNYPSIIVHCCLSPWMPDVRKAESTTRWIAHLWASRIPDNAPELPLLYRALDSNVNPKFECNRPREYLQGPAMISVHPRFSSPGIQTPNPFLSWWISPSPAAPPAPSTSLSARSKSDTNPSNAARKSFPPSICFSAVCACK